MRRESNMREIEVLGFRIHRTARADAARLVTTWGRSGESRVVLAANVHMVMEAWDDQGLRDQLQRADLVVADGRPLAWATRALGRSTEHIRGADLTLEVCRQAEEAGLPVGLYGSSPDALEGLRSFLSRRYPKLVIAFSVSPPYRALTPDEDEEMTQAVHASGARILFVSLGCPKQERWMMERRGKLPCVMLGAGAAFDFLAGTVPQAPGWMQRAGLEWIHRLASDPRRLWKRYLKHNPRFVALFAAQWVRGRWQSERNAP